MPIIIPGGGATSSTNRNTTTYSDIATLVARDASRSISPDHPVLLDYINRVCLELLRVSRWVFLESDPQYFITKKGVSDYWIGPTANLPVGGCDTGLNLSDVDRIKKDSVYDRSNFYRMKEVPDAPNYTTIWYQDRAPRLNLPGVYKTTYENPNLFSIYPAPMDNNVYQPVPPPPVCTVSTSGGLGARIYYVRTTYVDSIGNESTASANSTRVSVPANKVLVVKTPEPLLQTAESGATYSSYKVYVGTVDGSETLQSGVVNIGTDWTEPNTGLVAGAAWPTTNSIEPMNGFLIEFSYYKTRQIATDFSQIIQIPDEYKDVVVAGVSFYVANYQKQREDAQTWMAIYREGIKGMIRDKNLFPKGADFIRPDAKFGSYVPDPSLY